MNRHKGHSNNLSRIPPTREVYSFGFILLLESSSFSVPLALSLSRLWLIVDSKRRLVARCHLRPGPTTTWCFSLPLTLCQTNRLTPNLTLNLSDRREAGNKLANPSSPSRVPISSSHLKLVLICCVACPIRRPSACWPFNLLPPVPNF